MAVYQLTGSKVLLGTVAAVGSLPMLFLSVWGGSVADRHPKRTVVLFTQTGMMLMAFGFAALVGSGHIQPWHILVLAALGVTYSWICSRIAHRKAVLKWFLNEMTIFMWGVWVLNAYAAFYCGLWSIVHPSGGFSFEPHWKNVLFTFGGQ